jgi:hypothetical protein
VNEGAIVSVVALAAWLILAVTAYASYKLEWRTMVQQGFIWAAIFAAVTLVISLGMG